MEFSSFDDIFEQHKLLFDVEDIKLKSDILDFFNNKKIDFNNVDLIDWISNYYELTNKIKMPDNPYDLGLYYYITKNYVEMEKKLLLANTKEAYLFLADYYKQDPIKMEKYYLKGIELKCDICMNKLGNHYYEEKNYKDALKYYKMSIKLGNKAAMNNLGSYYKLKNNINLMMKYYLNASTPKSFYLLGKYYEEIEEYDEMIKYYEMSNNSNSIHRLGIYYEKIENHHEMKKCYLKSLELGNTESAYNLAKHYKKIDLFREVEKYYLMANDIEDVTIINYLARKYEPLNCTEAIKWYKEGIKLNSPISMFDLAMFYNAKGKTDEVIKYITMAAELNHVAAINTLIRYYVKDDEKLNYYLNHAIKENIPLNIFHLTQAIKTIDLYNKLIDIYLKLDIIPSELENAIIETSDKEYILNQLSPKSTNSIYYYIYENYVKDNIKCMDSYISDFTINVIVNENKYEYYVHSLIFDSEFFKVLIDGKFEKTKSVTIHISSLEIIDSLLKFMYLNIIEISDEKIDEFIVLANKYMFTRLNRLLIMRKYINKK